MSFESWENSMFEAHYGPDDGYEPDEDCPCGCEGDWEDCDYDPEEEDAIAQAESRMDDMEAGYGRDICPPGYDGR